MNVLGRNRQFLILLTGQGISIFGDQIYYVGLMWTIMKQTGSAMSLGMSVICMTLPAILIMPLAGVLADRNIKKQMVMIADAVRACIMAIVALFLFEGYFSLAIINLCLVIISVMDAFFNPALSATVPLILDKAGLSKGNAIFEFIRRISAILGPVVGGFLITFLSIGSVFALNGLSFLVSFIFSLFLKIPRVTQAKQRETFVFKFKEGLFYTIRMKRLLFLTLVGGVIINFFLAPLDVLIIFTSKQLNFGSTGVGWIEASISVGALLGSIAIFFGHIRSQIRLAVAGLIFEGVALILSGIFPGLIPFILFFGLLGLGISFASIGIGTTFQLITDDDKRGRVNSFGSMLSSCTVPLGTLFGSFLTGYLPLQWIFLLFGIVIAGAVTLLYVPFREELQINQVVKFFKSNF
ncbi:MFS transporter [Sporolactobacillus nakayamae]|uniref:Transmembrane secretion effector n=1 Tax=Sporolactobacillus nakayamae TaxID=269670 RepID=A0A1I2Q815_9BACL|nr:MFS transporter [Sporolactobacillus nakayamae]SFG24438.1 Transmembrane secretion effector [Sporolactobacillus nakayamae]